MKTKFALFLGLVVLTSLGVLFLNGCKKNTSDSEPGTDPNLPVLYTTTVVSVTQNTAISGGNITNEGGAAITARGVCWNTVSNPTVANNKTTDGDSTGMFTSSLANLVPNTTYYIRSYATNSYGTAYGNQLIITTLAIPPLTVTDLDGNVYHTVKIGLQTWMVENLRTTRYRNGDPLLSVTDNEMWTYCNLGSFCAYNNFMSNADGYGYLYNWFAVHDFRNICPAGWHVPSDAEWTTLSYYLSGMNVAGGKMKEAGTSHWLAPNTDATNSSGFTALPGGMRATNLNGDFRNFHTNGYWWTTTEEGNRNAWFRSLQNTCSKLSAGTASQFDGYSVRCIKD